jgi:copper transport protein
VAGLAVAVPRFSNVAFVSVLVLLASGTVATIIHLPIVAALWQTSYGEAILVKIGLLAAAMLIAAVNLLYTKPRLVAARDEGSAGEPAARLLRRVVSGEVVLVTAAIFAAAVLSSIAPPSSALAEENSALTRVGPGRVATVVHKGSYALQVLISPNRAAVPNTFAVKITKGGKPLRGASVSLTFAMLDMQMANQVYQLTETKPGIYSRASPALVMVGHWGLSFSVTPQSGQPFTALVADRAGG